MEGTTLGHYRILRKLGQGGMGSVYLATDTKLHRSVAVKFISEDLLRDSDGLKRFENEARAAAALNHPNIAVLYSVEEVEGRRFITMEYVDGMPLSAFMGSAGLTLEQFFAFAIPLAEAFSRAHERGIVHRDIKPANLLVSKEGVPKILDFGLAQFLEPEPAPSGELTSTVSRRLTQEGVLVGTIGYLSPEQAEGKRVDARSDIFGFGVVLYEMLTARSPFKGDSALALVSSILKDDPIAITTINPALPRDLGRIVERCLQKDLRRRYQTMLDVLNDLQAARREVEGAQRSARARLRSRAALAAVLLAGLALVAGTVIWLRTFEKPAEPDWAASDLLRLTTAPGWEDEPSWSPDRRSIVYASDEGGRLGLWIRQVSGERSLFIGNPDADEAQPAWSPDGDRIAFVSTRNHGGRFGIFLGSRSIEFFVYGQNGDLFVMPALGGTARKIADHAYDPSWSPDGRKLAYRSIEDGSWRLYTVSLDEGRPMVVDGVEPRALSPAWSPDGRYLAYVGSAGEAVGWDLYVVPAEGGTPVPLTRDRATVALRPTWSRDGRSILYSSNHGGALNLWSVPFDPDPPRSTGQPERLTTGVGEDVNPSVSPDGSSLAYATVRTAPSIWKLEVETGELTQLTNETTIEDYPRLSRDGTRLLFYSDRTGREEVWVLHLESRELTQLSRGGGNQNAWAPDGRRVAYATPRGLTILDLESSRAVSVGADLSTAYPSFSPDGVRVCFQGFDGKGYRLYQAPAAGGSVTSVPTPEGQPGNPSWSPDGQTIYFQLDRLGQRNIWAVDLRSGASRQITTGNTDDAHPDVSPDGRLLLFLRNHNAICTIPAEGGDPRLVKILKSFPGYNRLVEWPSWGPDGKSIVFSLAEKTGDVFVLSASRTKH